MSGLTLNQLAEKNAEYVTKIEELEKERDALAAENQQAINAITIFSDMTNEITEIICDEIGHHQVAKILDAYRAVGHMPATNAWCREMRAQTLMGALDFTGDYLDADCVMDRLGISHEEAELRIAGAFELHNALVNYARQLRAGGGE